MREEDGCVIIVARYKVSGNIPGHFEENVKPLVEDDENSDDEYEEEYGKCRTNMLLYVQLLLI